MLISKLLYIACHGWLSRDSKSTTALSQLSQGAPKKKTERIWHSETPSFIWIKSQIDFPDRQWKERDISREYFIQDVNLRLGWISFFWRETQGLLSLDTQQVNRLHLMRRIMCLGFIFLLLSHKQPKPKQKGRAVYLFVWLIDYLFIWWQQQFYVPDTSGCSNFISKWKQSVFCTLCLIWMNRSSFRNKRIKKQSGCSAGQKANVRLLWKAFPE